MVPEATPEGASASSDRSEIVRDDRTAIELFCLGPTGWDAGLRRCLDDVKSL